MELISSLTLNVVSNLVYDILKRHIVRINKNSINKKVEIRFQQYEDSSLDIGSFYEFLNNTNIQLLFSDYFKIISIGRENKEHRRENPLNKNEFIKKITESAVEYCDQRGSKINQREVYSFISDLIFILEENIIAYLPEHAISSTYFIKQIMDQMEVRILENMKQPLISINENLHQETYFEYINVLKDRCKINHVYGVRKLDFGKFYITPHFEYYIKNENDLQLQMNNKESKSKIVWKDVFYTSNIVSIIGGPGFGKTLFLKYLATNYEQLNLIDSRNILPIYCNLRTIAK